MQTPQTLEKQASASVTAINENEQIVNMDDIRICFPEAEKEIFAKIRQLEVDIAEVLYAYAKKVHALQK